METPSTQVISHSLPTLQTAQGRVAQSQVSGGRDALANSASQLHLPPSSPASASNHTAHRVADPQRSAAADQRASPSSARQSDDRHNQQLVNQQRVEVQRLAQRDREVRQHERIHAQVGGSYAGAPQLDLTRGPDGRFYATSGEVRIDTSAVPSDPKASIEKAEIIRRAALSVPEPSAQDRAVAALADQMKMEAQAELVRLESEAKLQAQADPAHAEQEAIGESLAESLGLADQSQEAQEAQAAEAAQKAEQDAEKGADKVNEQDDDQAKERVQDNAEQMQAQRDAAMAQIYEFNRDLNQLQADLAEINKRMLEAGAFEKLLPKGVLLDLII